MPFPGDGLDLLYMEIYGGFGYDWSAACSAFSGLAAGIPQTGNPAYTVSDFLSFYPQFFGPATTITGTVTSGSATITGISSTTGIQPGQLVSGAFPGGTVVLSVASTTVTLSNPATANAASVLIYEAPPIPLAVIQAYLNLAYASLMSSRWRELWVIAMGWYIAHFLTLYAQSMGNASSTPGQIAAQGLEQGLAVSKSAGPLSQTQQHLTALESWGAWAKTSFGTQLISQAQVMGAGAVYFR